MCAHHPDDGCVAAEDQQVEEEEEEEEEDLELRNGGEPAEHELSGAGLVEDGAPSKHCHLQRTSRKCESSFASIVGRKANILNSIFDLAFL